MDYKKDFPIFANQKDLVYLDSAATSQKPKEVIDSLKYFYENKNSNIHRGLYPLSENATKEYEESREAVSKFINASSEEIVFVKNATEGFNLLSNSIKNILHPNKNEIVLTEMEHHSNLIPWQIFAKKYNLKLRFIPITKDYELDYEIAEEIINERTALVSFTYSSNVLGTINNVKTLINLAKGVNAISIVDAAQIVAHLKVDVKEIDCDFLVFSAHKMFGPLGVGVVYGKTKLFDKMDIFIVGGGMIDNVEFQSSSYKDSPRKFEAGTQDIAGVIAFKSAIEYINRIGFKGIKEYERKLLNYLLNRLNEIEGISIFNPGKDKSVALASFNLKGIHPHDVAHILSEEGIAIRTGNHCCMPLIQKLMEFQLCEFSGVCRVSLSIYNTFEDIDNLILGLNKVKEIFKNGS